MCGRYALALESCLENKVKDIKVYTHKGIDPRLDQRRRELSIQAMKLWQAQYRFTKSINRKGFEVGQADEPRGLHARASNAHKRHFPILQHRSQGGH